MHTIGPSSHTLNSGQMILQHDGRNLGVSWSGAHGSLGGAAYRIHILVMIREHYTLSASFPGESYSEVVS